MDGRDSGRLGVPRRPARRRVRRGWDARRRHPRRSSGRPGDRRGPVRHRPRAAVQRQPRADGDQHPPLRGRDRHRSRRRRRPRSRRRTCRRDRRRRGLARPPDPERAPARARRTPSELIAANVASSLGEGLGTFAGPSWPASSSPRRGRSRRACSSRPSSPARRRRHGCALRGRGRRSRGSERGRWRTRPDRRCARGAAAVSDGHARDGRLRRASLRRGVFIALTVAISIELLDLGEGGVGLLNSAVGLGGLVGALGALGLAGGARLGTVFVVALAVWDCLSCSSGLARRGDRARRALRDGGEQRDPRRLRVHARPARRSGTRTA